MRPTWGFNEHRVAVHLSVVDRVSASSVMNGGTSNTTGPAVAAGIHRGCRGQAARDRLEPARSCVDLLQVLRWHQPAGCVAAARHTLCKQSGGAVLCRSQPTSSRLLPLLTAALRGPASKSRAATPSSTRLLASPGGVNLGTTLGKSSKGYQAGGFDACNRRLLGGFDTRQTSCRCRCPQDASRSVCSLWNPPVALLPLNERAKGVDRGVATFVADYGELWPGKMAKC